jgi:hypothetical protein
VPDIFIRQPRSVSSPAYGPQRFTASIPQYPPQDNAGIDYNDLLAPRAMLHFAHSFAHRISNHSALVFLAEYAVEFRLDLIGVR